jgi:hypothetical protein
VNRNVIFGGLAAAVVFAGVWYVARQPDEPAPADGVAAAAPGAPASVPAAQDAPVARAAVEPVRPAIPADPRLAALMVTPDNGLIEFVPGPDGRVIQELDNDSSSVSYRKPLREYTYHGDKVAGLTVYKYLGDQLQIVRADVTYKPDGSVDAFRESTRYEKLR